MTAMSPTQAKAEDYLAWRHAPSFMRAARTQLQIYYRSNSLSWGIMPFYDVLYGSQPFADRTMFYTPKHRLRERDGRRITPGPLKDYYWCLDVLEHRYKKMFLADTLLLAADIPLPTFWLGQHGTIEVRCHEWVPEEWAPEEWNVKEWNHEESNCHIGQGEYNLSTLPLRMSYCFYLITRALLFHQPTQDQGPVWRKPEVYIAAALATMPGNTIKVIKEKIERMQKAKLEYEDDSAGVIQRKLLVANPGFVNVFEEFGRTDDGRWFVWP